MIATNVGRVAVDAGNADSERCESVRRRRVVLTSRCWRQCTWRQQLSGRNGGKRAVLRGELVISRKAIAQGMSDALRCPVCSCAHFFYPLHMRPRVQRAPGIPCALCLEGANYRQNSRTTCRENAKVSFSSFRGALGAGPESIAQQSWWINGFRAQPCGLPRNDEECDTWMNCFEDVHVSSAKRSSDPVPAIDGHDEKAMTSPDLPAELKAALDAKLRGFSRNDAAERRPPYPKPTATVAAPARSAPRPMRWPMRWRGCLRPMPRSRRA